VATLATGIRHGCRDRESRRFHPPDQRANHLSGDDGGAFHAVSAGAALTYCRDIAGVP
jgi:hypothetical protein